LRRPAYGFEPYESCQTCTWRTERFFCALSPPALTTFDRASFINVYPPGSVLFSEGQAARGLFMICHGSAKLSIASADGKTLIVRIAHSGEALGLSGVVSGHDYKTTAETIEPTQIRFIKRDDFLRFLSEYHDVCRKTATQLAEECDSETDQIRAIGLSHSAGEKLAHLILTWAAETGKESDNGVRIQVLMTHHDIAQLIGTSRETVTRLLKDFRDRQIIATKGSTITVKNRAALEALVSM
jgi:CRP/FNR family transcriptional regulator